MKNIYYLYAYATHDLLYVGTDAAEYERIFDQYENAGITCYGQDFDSMVNNIKMEQDRLEEVERGVC